jgi:hypothetical protein
MELAVAVETLCRIVLRAREYETLIPAGGSDDTGPAGDPTVDEIDDDAENPAEVEIRAIIDDLAEDERAEIIALAMIGRGDFDIAEWADAIDAASDELDSAADWMLEQPTLSSDLETGLAAFGLSCDGLGTIV